MISPQIEENLFFDSKNTNNKWTNNCKNSKKDQLKNPRKVKNLIRRKIINLRRIVIDVKKLTTNSRLQSEPQTF